MKKLLSVLLSAMFITASFGIATEAKSFTKAGSKTFTQQSMTTAIKTAKAKTKKKLIKKTTTVTKTTVHKSGNTTTTTTTTTKTKHK